MVCLVFARQVIRSNLLSLVRSDPLDGMAVCLVMWQYVIVAISHCGNVDVQLYWHNMAFLNLNVIPSTLTFDIVAIWQYLIVAMQIYTWQLYWHNLCPLTILNTVVAYHSLSYGFSQSECHSVHSDPRLWRRMT